MRALVDPSNFEADVEFQVIFTLLFHHHLYLHSGLSWCHLQPAACIKIMRVLRNSHGLIGVTMRVSGPFVLSMLNQHVPVVQRSTKYTPLTFSMTILALADYCTCTPYSQASDVTVAATIHLFSPHRDAR